MHSIDSAITDILSSPSQSSGDDVDDLTRSTLDHDEDNSVYSLKEKNAITELFNRLDGIAHSLVEEFQNMKHFVEEKEEKIEEKIVEWKGKAVDFKEQVKKQIERMKIVVQNRFQRESFTFSRVRSS